MIWINQRSFCRGRTRASLNLIVSGRENDCRSSDSFRPRRDDLWRSVLLLLVYLIGWMSTRQRPGWWIGMFPTRRIGALGWLILLHTSAVLLAALPIAVAAVLIERTRAVLLALTAAVLATVAAVAPSLSSTILPIIWNNSPT